MLTKLYAIDVIIDYLYVKHYCDMTTLLYLPPKMTDCQIPVPYYALNSRQIGPNEKTK